MVFSECQDVTVPELEFGWHSFVIAPARRVHAEFKLSGKVMLISLNWQCLHVFVCVVYDY